MEVGILEVGSLCAGSLEVGSRGPKEGGRCCEDTIRDRKVGLALVAAKLGTILPTAGGLVSCLVSCMMSRLLG